MQLIVCRTHLYKIFNKYYIYSQLLSDKTDPIIYGEWEPIQYRFKYLPVHVALLHTGKVLAFGGSGNDPKYLKHPHPAEIFEPDEVGKHNGNVYEISNADIKGDIFCAGHSFLQDGKLLVVGGTFKYDNSLFGIPFPPFRGMDNAHIFDPKTLTWKQILNMKNSRWYPTCVMNSDGSVLVMAGLTKNFPWVFLNKIEILENGQHWKYIDEINRWLPLYPRLHLLPNGEIFYAGSFNTHYTFPFSVKGFPSATLNIKTKRWHTIGNPNNTNREEGTTVLLPLVPPEYTTKVLLIAGGTPQGNDAIPDVEIIDFSEKKPQYKEFAKLKHPRYYVYPVILPDKSILVLGGKVGKKGHLHDDMSHQHNHDHGDGELSHHPDAVLEPELLDPETNMWHPMADMKVDRLYHSNALLLPDGRIMTAGSNPQRTENELRIEVFKPPYLFRGERPIIKRCNTEIDYNQKLEIETDNSEEIKEICLIRPSSTTHCVNTEQRYVGLEFEIKSRTIINANIPDSPNLAPPGYYMLFIIDNKVVPSIACFIKISMQ
jgi:hypothetical protein